VLRSDTDVSKRRYVRRGVPAGYRIWDNKARRWWGDLYEKMPDDLVAELNSDHDPQTITSQQSDTEPTRRSGSISPDMPLMVQPIVADERTSLDAA
jgi:hypothetical protein